MVLTDLDQERVDRGLTYVGNEIAKLATKGRISTDAANRLAGQLSGSTDQTAFADCDFVLEQSSRS